jgi:hypothetical protein
MKQDLWEYTVEVSKRGHMTVCAESLEQAKQLVADNLDDLNTLVKWDDEVEVLGID